MHIHTVFLELEISALNESKNPTLFAIKETWGLHYKI